MKLDECPPAPLFPRLIRAGKRTLAVVNRLTVCIVLPVVANCVLLSAQNVVLTGALGGRITDPSGAVAPSASVVVQSLATGVQQTAQTNHDGLYRFPVVMPGTYSITASLKGFRDVQVLVRVLVGNTTSQDIKLQVGASADTVKVIGTTPLLRRGVSYTHLHQDLDIAKTSETCHHGIGARRDHRKPVKSRMVCRGGLLHAGREIPHNDRRSRYDRSALVGDTAADCSG